MARKEKAETGQIGSVTPGTSPVALAHSAFLTAAPVAKDGDLKPLCDCSRHERIGALDCQHNADALGVRCRFDLANGPRTNLLRPWETPPPRDAVGDPPSPSEEFLADLRGWLAHARSVNDPHVSIPCSAMERVIRCLTPEKRAEISAARKAAPVRELPCEEADPNEVCFNCATNHPTHRIDLCTGCFKELDASPARGQESRAIASVNLTHGGPHLYVFGVHVRSWPGCAYDDFKALQLAMEINRAAAGE
jgi:hypothetical protein